MKLKELFIQKYGPIKNKNYIFSDNFNLVFGKNEQGKSLAIDALVKFLLGKKAKKLDKINRVEDFPDGYLSLQYQSKNIDLKADKKFQELTGLSWEDCRNVFVIRDSDLSLFQESQYYTNLTSKLTGLQSGRIDEINNNLRDIGLVTESGQFKNTQDDNKLADRLRNARNLQEKIDQKIKDIKKQNLDNLEKKLLSIKNKINKTSQKIQDLNNAREREKYEKAQTALKNLTEIKEKLQKLTLFTEQGRDDWQKKLHNLEVFKKEQKEIVQQINQLTGEVKIIENKYQQQKQEFVVFESQKRVMDSEIVPLVETCQIKKVKLEQTLAQYKIFVLLFRISLVFGILSSIGVLMNPGLVVYLVLIISVLGLAFAFWKKMKLANEKSGISQLEKKLSQAFAKLGVQIKDLDQALSETHTFQVSFSQKSKSFKETEIKFRSLTDKLTDIKESRLVKNKEEKNDLDQEIIGFQSKFSVKNFQDYKDKLTKKNKYENKQNEINELLKEYFGNRVFPDSYQQELAKLEKYKNSGIGIVYGLEKLNEVREKLEHLEQTHELAENKLKQNYAFLQDTQVMINKIFVNQDKIPCDSLSDLRKIAKELNIFITEHENTKNNILQAVKIFNLIKQEEGKKVAELFGENNLVSKRFNQITNNLYSQVFFENNQILVENKDKEILKADQLSGGAFDQLYLAIRLSLGEKLLKNEKGFFVLDDAFIKSDIDRLSEQLQILTGIAEQGWQIIYFSAKQEVLDWGLNNKNDMLKLIYV